MTETTTSPPDTITRTSSSSLPSTTKNWLLQEFNKPYELTELPLPKLTNPHDILIRVTAGSYCHTDALVAAGIVPPRPPLPHVGCHEYAGTVVALPDGQSSCHGYNLGDRVAVSGRGNHVCGECMECSNDSAVLPDEKGYSVYCPVSGAGLGVDRWGGFREYAVVDARQVGRIPEGLDAIDVAPLMCAGLTIYAALKKLNLKKGQRVAIMGIGGGLGHLGLQFASKMGLKVLGIDVGDRQLQLAKDVAANLRNNDIQIVDARATKPEELRKQLGAADSRLHFEQSGVNAAIILPESQAAFDFGCALTRNGGKILVLSFPPEGFHFSAFDVVIRRLSIEGSLIGSNRAMDEMFDFCLEHNVRAVKTVYGFEKLNELVGDYHAGGVAGKLVVDMGR